jgi:hypothetical protein
LTKEVDEAFEHVTGEILRSDLATRGDRRAHLIEVGRAGVTLGQVLFEPAALAA